MYQDIKDSLKPLADLLLSRKGAACLAICGAGGKSSLAADLSAVLKQTGRAALIAPATTVFHPRLPGLHAADTAVRSNPQFCDAVLLRKGRALSEFYADIRARLKESAAPCLALAENAADSEAGRILLPLETSLICEIRALLEEDNLSPALLCEADAAEKLPLAARAEGEIHIPACADAVVVVMGLDALGRPLSAVCCHAGIAARLCDCAEDDLLTPALASQLLLHPEGSFRDTPANASRFVLLNKMDLLLDTRHKALDELHDLLLASGSLEAVLLRSQSDEHRD